MAFEHLPARLAEPRPIGLQTALNRAFIPKILAAEALGIAGARLTLVRCALRHREWDIRYDNCNGENEPDHHYLVAGRRLGRAGVADEEHAQGWMVPFLEAKQPIRAPP